MPLGNGFAASRGWSREILVIRNNWQHFYNFVFFGFTEHNTKEEAQNRIDKLNRVRYNYKK